MVPILSGEFNTTSAHCVGGERAVKAPTCRVPMIGTRMEVCLIRTSLAMRGRPPAFLMHSLFFCDLERDLYTNK